MSTTLPAASDPLAADSAPAPRRSSGRRWLRRAAWVAALWAVVYHGLPRLLTIPEPLTRPPDPGVDITDARGTPLRRVQANGRRVETLDYAQIPRSLVDATISAEDQRFWTHGGIDFLGTIRAVVDSVAAGRPVSGASTITQQLVKVASGRYTDRSWRDKLREMAYARKVETSWSKERILTDYLQRVEYGNQATGCAAAAELYFRKPVSDLSLAEAAFLAGLPQAPTRLNPFRNFEGAKTRQKWILSRMVEDGRITPAEEEAAAKEKLHLRRWTGAWEAPHFVDMLLAERSVERGERIRTTLDLELQQFCDRTVRLHVGRLAEQGVREASVVVLDNRTGGVRALVGSPDYFDERAGQVNGALAARSAGSTLKPFTYLLAMQAGDHPGTIVDDLPIEFMTGTGLYRPENYDRHCYGPVSYREALANSLNISAVRVLQRVGGADVLQAALQSAGFTTLTEAPEHYGLGLTIGNAEVRLLELANAYACLARLGEWRPVVLRADEETGNAATGGQRFSPEATWLVIDVLSDPQARARCFGLASPLRLSFPAAVKTGTSTDFRDNWCVGFTPEFTVAVWAGNFDRRPMKRVSGVSGAAPVWREVMAWLERHRGCTWFERPEGIADMEVDPLTGERVPAAVADRRPVVLEKCLAESPPSVAPEWRYDALGRVVLARDYARWLRSDENWRGAQAIAGNFALRDDAAGLKITSPLPGSTLILDPDLPDSGALLPLKSNAAGVTWQSGTLPIEVDDGRPYARLVPGRHTLQVTTATGESAVAAITVKSL